MELLQRNCVIYTTILCFCFFSCKEENGKIIKVNYGGLIAEGNIDTNKDTSFEGLIKFYDPKTNRLKYEETYRSGVAHGSSRIYYSNGRIETELTFHDGKELGFVSHYDSNGKLLSRNYMYYGVRVGPSEEYTNGSLKSYDFYSFDDNLLFTLDYDSLPGHKITDLQKGFLYYLSSDVSHENEHEKSFLLYVLNPPQYKFEYSLVLVDEKYNVKKVIEHFEPTSVFVKFRTELNIKDFKYALRLKLHDTVNDQTSIMFKILN